MKKVIFICLLACLSQSCKDLLDEKVVSGVTSEYYSTRAGFEDAVKASYAPLRSFYATELGMSLTVFGTDTYTNGADGSWKFLNTYTNQFDARTGLVTGLWNNMYLAINTCNTVVDRANAVKGLDETLKNRRVAEARFLRAHYYFLLVQTFGPVHLTLSENTQVTTNASRASVKDVYDAIVTDLEFAAANLEVKPADYGRASVPAAEHLLARVHLTRATSEARQTDDYQKAATYAKKVINNYNFRLLPDFAKVFEQGSGEINDEVIWAVQYTSDPLTNGGGNNAHVFFLMEYDVEPGMQRDVTNGRPFKRFRPTDFTLNTLFRDRLNDTRYEKSFKTVFLANKAGAAKATFDAGKTFNFALGDTTIWIPGYNANDQHLLLPGPKLTQEQFNAKPYQVLTPAKYSERLYPSLTKFLDPLRPDRTTFEGSRDFLAFRLAETYLIAAEALMYTNQPLEAAQYINAVRWRAARVGRTDAETAAHRAALTVTPDQLNIDFILDERGRELLGEQFRWFDLVRTGKLVERVKKYNPQAAPNIRDVHMRRPIPQDQIDRTAGGADAFPQNDGY